MEAFTISVASDVLDDLRSRLTRTRFTTPSASGWEAGTDPDYLRSLVDYWANEFDWPAAEARLNSYPQFRDRGQHFVHVRRDATRPPVLLAHGWPSSFIEMLPLLELLDVDVVVPSLPGFLYSDLVDGPLTRAAIAETFHTLMTETLGYERYFAFGGDIGGAASGWLATMYPREVAGLHMIHGPFPADFDASPITPAEQAFLDAEAVYDESDEGYSSIMSTRPDTIAAALADSPAGLAAWIIDKYRSWSDCGGDLESRFDRDTLCTILTLYWVTGCIGTSFRQYLDYPHNAPRPMIPVPVAVTLSHEPGMHGFPRSIAERAAGDIRRYSAPGRGGHFLALEEPRLIADELTAFMRSIG
ncbi:epoxide hydrolase family protein [Agromyces ramosus]|uniref:Pimeloyl-ACP methyl ester carboxylesterase n=1 Tax=Agromyces ramosus TaxID=33879 RepID=A0ABU0RG68_9MICO|nr:epoxide hydrolase family protein [Agromyces ramosus]MDQ0896034.1 pimeloyl-ACP methyl ester carboxylesterase [Agromyces ramosus]